jgi:hypothetical protein
MIPKVCDIIGKPRRVVALPNRGVALYSEYFYDEIGRIFRRHFGRDLDLFEYRHS